jgi:hypothetical protein
MLRHKRVLAAVAETTPGTAMSLTAAEAQFNAFDVTIQKEIEFIQRDGRAAFSRFQGSTGTRGGVVTFSLRHQPGSSGTLPPWASTFLPACGFKNTTGTFTPATEAPGSNVKTLTIGAYEDGLVKSIKGAVGMFTITMVSGQPILWNFTFRGIWVAPAAATILAPTYPTTSPLRTTGAGLTIGAWSPTWQQLTIDSGNQLYVREDGNAADGSGLAYGMITDRVVTGTINPEAVLPATKDYYAEFLSHTEQALALNVNNGTVGMSISMPKVQFTNLAEGDRSGVQIDDLSFQANGSAAAGDDEISLVFDST